MCMVMVVRHLTLRFMIPVLGLTAMIALALLYQLEPESYHRVIAFIGIEPSRFPFLDFQFILTAVDCWQRGVDVYANNPCDALDRPFSYPPLWLRFSILPSKDWTNLLGMCLTVTFFLALAALPPPRSGKELLARLVATLSPTTVFALERGNIDLLMFVIATAAGVLLLRPLRARVTGYAIIIIAGLLKIYPFVLMVLTLRERPRVFLWVNGAAAAVVLAAGVYFHAELVKMVPNIPRGQPFSVFAFGAHLVPVLISQRLGTAVHFGVVELGLIKVASFVALVLAMAGWFFRMVRWRDFCVALGRLPEPEKMFLLIGATLICGSFLTGSNIGYRGIHVLFTLPGLLTMARTESDMRVQRVAVLGCVLVVTLTWAGFLMWDGTFPRIVASWIGSVPSGRLTRGLWFLVEMAWWLVSTIFIAILIGCCSKWLEGRRLVRRATPLNYKWWNSAAR